MMQARSMQGERRGQAVRVRHLRDAFGGRVFLKRRSREIRDGSGRSGAVAAGGAILSMDGTVRNGAMQSGTVRSGEAGT